jgi:hypothetical protein
MAVLEALRGKKNPALLSEFLFFFFSLIGKNLGLVEKELGSSINN